MDIYKDVYYFLFRPHSSGWVSSLILMMAILPFWTTWWWNGFRMPWWKYIESWYYIDIEKQDNDEDFKKFDTLKNNKFYTNNQPMLLQYLFIEIPH